MSKSDDPQLELHIDEALADYLRRSDSGERLDREAFLAKHAGLRPQLEELLSAADWIEQLAGPTAADSGIIPSPSVANALAPEPSGDASLEDTLPHVTAGEEPLGIDRSVPSPDHGLPSYPSSSPAAQSPSPATQPRPGESHLSRPQPSQTLPLGNSGNIDFTGPSFTGAVVAGSGIAGQLTDNLQAAVTRKSSALSVGESAASDRMKATQPVLPCRFGEYELLSVLGRGGMGVVYSARQINLERTVAVKMIRSGALASSDEVRRFYAEARNAARLDHPHIVTVYQCGEIDGHHYFSMDYVEGTDLSRMTKDKPIDGKRAARYVRDVARAIQFAHDRGILHRDLKPANVLVDEYDRVHITDFGLAKTIGNDTGLTASGAALGTPSYMSPEQAAGRTDEHHHATDIYSLGAILFSLVTGQPPFKGAGVVQTIMHVIHRPAPRARSLNKSVHEDLETIIDVCLQKSPERRYPTAQALADDLDRYLLGVPIQARPISTLRRAWYWLLGVPIFGAILDHRVVEPTEAHRWFQRGLISIALLMLCAWALLLIPSSVWYKNRMPRSVRFASGVPGGSYESVSTAVADALKESLGTKTQVITSAGSSDNLQLLLDGQVDLAMLQADALGVNSVAVVAPLYYEVVHIIVRSGSGLKSIAELQNKSVIVGSSKGGSRAIAEQLLSRAGVSVAEVQLLDNDWREIAAETSTADAAIAVSKAGSKEVRDLLQRGDYSLLPVPDAWEFALEEPAFHSFVVSGSNYPDCPLPEAGITTVATTAYLATRFDASTALIQQVLAELYEPSMVEMTGILSAERAAHWQGIAWHPAARDFFQSYHGIPSKTAP